MSSPATFTIPQYFDYFAILLWATSGAIVGWRKGYDFVGVFVLAFVSSFGGGLLRDGLFLQRLPVVLTDSNYYWILLAAVIGVSVVGRRIQRDRNFPKIVSVIDALGVPMFVIIGIELGVARGLQNPAIVLIGTVSGVGGGLLRDMMAGDTPELLRPGQYNTLLVVVAAVIYLFLGYTLGYSRVYSAWVVIIGFFITRLLIIRFNWRTRPVNEFEVRRMLEGLSGWIPGWKKENDEQKDGGEGG